MIETRHLTHILAVAGHRHFGQAAEEVHLTQPALTRSIQAAERKLGVRLFDRDRSGVEPTVFGRMVIERGGAILADLRELERVIELERGLESGTLAVSMAPYPGALSGQRAVGRLLGAFPNLTCRVQVGDWRRVTEDVMEGSIDLGIADVGDAAGHPHLRIEVLNRCPIRFFCRPGHPLLSKRTVTVTDLVKFPWAATRAPARMAKGLPDPPGPAGRWEPTTGAFIPAIETDMVTDFAVLARMSDVLVASTLGMVEEDLEAGRVAVVPYNGSWLRLNYGFIVRRGRTLPPAAVELMHIVRELELELAIREGELRGQYF